MSAGGECHDCRQVPCVCVVRDEDLVPPAAQQAVAKARREGFREGIEAAAQFVDAQERIYHGGKPVPPDAYSQAGRANGNLDDLLRGIRKLQPAREEECNGR